MVRKRFSSRFPAYVFARWHDLERPLDALIATDERLGKTRLDPVIAATMIAFGFVFIHPFADGNGQLHRYLIHHVLAEHGFSRPGIVFPVSAVILERVAEYRQILE